MDMRVIDMSGEDLRAMIKGVIAEAANAKQSNQLLGRTEAARYLGCCTATVDRYAKTGKLEFVRHGKIRRFKVQELDRFLESKTIRA